MYVVIKILSSCRCPSGALRSPVIKIELEKRQRKARRNAATVTHMRLQMTNLGKTFSKTISMHQFATVTLIYGKKLLSRKTFQMHSPFCIYLVRFVIHACKADEENAIEKSICTN